MSKRTERKLRELAGLAHERALASALGDLSREFERWREGATDPFELNDKIHEFHNKTARKIYSFHAGAEPKLVVAAAVRDGILTREEVGDELFFELSAMIDAFTSVRGGTAA
ncbi:MAG: hypothetical protein WCE38_09935 [Burkholderiales bacterium]